MWRSRRSTTSIWPGTGGRVTTRWSAVIIVYQMSMTMMSLRPLLRSVDHLSADNPVPAAFTRPAGGSSFDLRPFTRAEAVGCGPRVVIHVHVSDQTLIGQHGVVRTEHGPVTLDQFRRWLTQADPTITVRPVLDPAATAAVDAYEIPQRLRQAMTVRHPGSVWPFSPATTISTGGRLDLDHTIPHTKHGPPGQTSMGNLGPLTRTEHRAKTLGGWQARQPDIGTYLWRSPDGLVAVTTNQGTLLLGDRHWAHQVWTTADTGLRVQDSGRRRSRRRCRLQPCSPESKSGRPGSRVAALGTRA